MFSDWHHASLALVTIFAMGLSGLFDAIGTLVGIGNQTGIFSKQDQQSFNDSTGFNSKMDRALIVDTFTTAFAGIVGTSNTTTFIESASGVAAGARTGLANIVTAAGFALMILFAPFVGVVPTAATSPLLILVGIMMMGEFKKISWESLEFALPAFFTSVFMALSYSISYGIAAGFIFFIIVKFTLGKFKEVSPVLLIVSAFFLLNFIALAFI
nr:NCS2 family permease [uncultured Leuconostoc sp.]